MSNKTTLKSSSCSRFRSGATTTTRNRSLSPLPRHYHEGQPIPLKGLAPVFPNRWTRVYTTPTVRAGWEGNCQEWEVEQLPPDQDTKAQLKRLLATLKRQRWEFARAYGIAYSI